MPQPHFFFLHIINKKCFFGNKKIIHVLFNIVKVGAILEYPCPNLSRADFPSVIVHLILPEFMRAAPATPTASNCFNSQKPTEERES